MRKGSKLRTVAVISGFASQRWDSLAAQITSELNRSACESSQNPVTIFVVSLAAFYHR